MKKSDFVEQSGDESEKSSKDSESTELKDPTGEFDLLPDRKDLFRNILETPNVGIGLTDEDEKFVFANPAGERLFGVDSLTGRSLVDFIPADSISFVKTKTRRRKAGQQDTYDLEIVLPNGKKRWLLVNATPRFDDEKHFLGTQGIFLDITGHVEAEKAYRESEERYRRLIEGIPFGVGLVQEGCFVFANRAALRMLGFESFYALKGVKAIDVIPDYEKERIRTLLSGLASGRKEGPIGFMIKVERSIGAPLSIEVLVTAVQHSGKPALQVFMVDVTEKMKAEEERIRLEERLIDAEKMQSVGRLAGGVAHDFNNLLTPILGYAEMGLVRLGENDPMRDDLKEIRDAAEKARLLVQQLLAFGGKQRMRMVPLDCATIIDSIAPMLRRVIREDIAIIYRLSPERNSVSGDSAQLEQVLVHLAINARDAMPFGGELEISTRTCLLDEADLDDLPELLPGRHVVIDVRDTGRGMDPEETALIFEPFYTTKAKGKSAGLGLATVHGIVKQHGGHITVDSRLGVGSTFSIYLPLMEAPGEEKNGVFAHQNVKVEGKTVLLVEDSGPVRRQVSAFLLRKGMIVRAAAGPVEALRIAEEEQRIDLLITDVVMPGMSGEELYVKLKNSLSDLPVIFISGYSEDSIFGDVEEIGLFLAKPFTMDALLEHVKRALSLES